MLYSKEIAIFIKSTSNELIIVNGVHTPKYSTVAKRVAIFQTAVKTKCRPSLRT